MVYVEWKYFNAVPKGRVVADTEMLCWDVRHYCVVVMMAKLSNRSADSMLQLHRARQLRGLWQQSSVGPVLSEESVLTPPMPAFSALFTLLPFLSTVSL